MEEWLIILIFLIGNNFDFLLDIQGKIPSGK